MKQRIITRQANTISLYNGKLYTCIGDYDPNMARTCKQCDLKAQCDQTDENAICLLPLGQTRLRPTNFNHRMVFLEMATEPMTPEDVKRSAKALEIISELIDRTGNSLKKLSDVENLLEVEVSTGLTAKGFGYRKE